MVSKPSRGEAIARWVMTVLTALWVAGAVMVVPFGCAVGEYEDDRDCSVPEISVGELAHQLQEAVDVQVVERRLDLVEDVEGARARKEDREHERQRDQRLLAA